MSDRAQVILFNPDPVEAAAWQRALAEAADTRLARNEAQLVALAAGPVDVLVAPCDAGLLEVVQRCRGHARLVLCGSTLPEGVIDAAGEGTDLRHVATPEQLRRAVLALARPRSPMARQRVPGLTVTHGTFPPAEVLDLSNRGFSFRLELDQPLESFLPGAQLRAPGIRRGELLVLEATHAQVRYVEQARDAGGQSFYRVGCELPAGSAEAAGPGRGTRIDDAATCVGLLRVALRQGGLLLHSADDESESLACERGRVDLERQALVLEASGATFEPYEVVRCTFELGGSSYTFLSTVTSSVPLQVRLPRVVEAIHRRSATRHRPVETMPISARVINPLFDPGSATRQVLEISGTGFSFSIDPSTDLFPPGLRLPEVELTLGATSVRCKAEVRNLSAWPGATGALRCGVVFTGLSAEGRGQLADALMRSRFPGLADACEFPAPQLWSFLQESGFLYAKKMEALTPMLATVSETFQRLTTQTGNLFKAVVFHEHRQLYAHTSAVRSHSRTFVVQHLAATSRPHGRQGSRAVNLGITEFLAQDQHLDFAKVYFRPDNKWPARVFGGYARRVTDRQLSDLRVLDYLLYPTSARLPETPGLRVFEAQPGDLGVGEGHYVASERGLILRSDDLTRGTLSLGAVDREYRAAGLFRLRRTLLAVRPDDTPVGFALCEISSPGLNLSELLSSMRLVVLPAGDAPGMPGAAAVRVALLREALGLYRQAGRPFAPLLKAPGEPDPDCQPLERKVYACWTGHRSLLRPFGESLNRTYELLERAQELRKRVRAPVPADRIA